MCWLDWIYIVIISGLLPRIINGQCDPDDDLLYPHDTGDIEAVGDDGPSVMLDLHATVPGTFFRFYGDDYTIVYFNMNGQISFDSPTYEWMPTTAAVSAPAFLTAFWNDLSLTVAGGDGVLRMGSYTDSATLARARADIGVKDKDINPTLVVVATWENVPSYDDVGRWRQDPSYIMQVNTFQVVLVMDNQGNSFALFHYSKIEWYVAHSTAAVAMLNAGQDSGAVFNLYASSNELMLTLDDTCGNAGADGRFIFQTDLDIVRLLDKPVASTVIEGCLTRETPLYPYGQQSGDTSISVGDDLASPAIVFANPVTYYGNTYTQCHVNTNGPISFGSIFPQWQPSTVPEFIPFLAAFWNDINLVGISTEAIYLRLTSDPGLLARFKGDVGSIAGSINPTELLVATWVNVRPYNANDDLGNTFQVIFGYEGSKSYTIFIYTLLNWYRDTRGNFAVSVFNKGGASTVILDAGPTQVPAWYFRPECGTSVINIGMFVYETAAPSIVRQDTHCMQECCTCQISSEKKIETYDGQDHEFLHAQRNRMSRYLIHDDPCKYQLTVRTVYNTSAGSMDISSVSFGFAVHTRQLSKFDKNILIFPDGVILWRGREIQVPYEVQPPLEWTSDDGQTTISLSGDIETGWVINSTTCPYRVHYAPRGPGPVLQFTINKAAYNPQYLIGLCQDCNDDPGNDYRPCREDTTDNWQFWKKTDISETELSEECGIPDSEDSDYTA